MSKAVARILDKSATELRKQLKSAEEVFQDVLNFANLGLIPIDLQRTEGERLKPWTEGGEIEFFSEDKGQPIFFHLMAQLTSRGIRFRDLTQWRKPSLPRAEEVVGEGVEAAGPVASEGTQPQAGRFRHFGSAISSAGHKIGEFLSGPDWDSLASLDALPEEPEDPYNHLAKIYDDGCVMVHNYKEGSAPHELRNVRKAIAMYVAGLLRDLRMYINDRVERTGDQLTAVASA